MPYRSLAVGVLGVLSLAAAIGCNDSNSATGPTCPAVAGQSLDVTVSAGDWTVRSVAYADPSTGDTLTSISGTALIDQTISGVGPGDTLVIRIVLKNPLVIGDPVPPGLTLAVSGGNESGCTSVFPSFAVEDGGDWDLQTTNGGVYGPSCAGGTIHGFWNHFVPGTIAAGRRLTCLISTFVVPTTFQGQGTIASGQVLTVGKIGWYTTMSGDRTGDPPPVQAR